MFIENEQLKRFIVDSGLMSRGELDDIEKESIDKKDRLDNFLVSRGKVNEDDIRRIHAHVLGIPFVSLLEEKIPFEILSLIPEPIARKNNIVVYRKTDDFIEVAMLDINDLSAIDFIKKKISLKILPRLTSSESIKSSLVHYQKSLRAHFGDNIQKEVASLKASEEKVSEDLSILRVTNGLLKHAILQNASDIHIEPQENELVIRYRIDGILHDAMILPKAVTPSITTHIKILSGLRLDVKQLPQDGRLNTELDNEHVTFRVSFMPTHFGEKIVLRFLKAGSSGFTLEALGFHGQSLERLHEVARLTTGMILVSGLAYSGKTATLYSLLDILNTPNVSISTIEDPVEYKMKRINQTQVKPEIGLTFSSGLRSLVRQNPDIIMIGEIHDHETASLAVNAVLTNCLVLSAIRGNSAASTISHLIATVQPFLLASTLNIVIGQRLVKQLSQNKEKYFLTKGEVDSMAKKVNMDKVLLSLKAENIIDTKASWIDIPFYKPKSSEDSEDGYRGRVGIQEVLKVTPTIRNLIINGATTMEIEKQAKDEGMFTMIEDGLFKAAQGMTSIKEVLKISSE